MSDEKEKLKKKISELQSQLEKQSLKFIKKEVQFVKVQAKFERQKLNYEQKIAKLESIISKLKHGQFSYEEYKENLQKIEQCNKGLKGMGSDFTIDIWRLSSQLIRK